MKPRLTGIVAMTSDHIIGRNGTLPWHLPADLAFFKRTTSGHPVVMGRKTYESIGRPLPNRRNIVLTRNPAWSTPHTEVIHSPADLLALPNLPARIFIIGGADIYEMFLPMLDDLLVSHIHHPHPGDTRFPPFEHDFPFSEPVESHTDFDVRHWSRKP